MAKVKRARGLIRVPTVEGKIILDELQLRCSSLSGWLDDNGLSMKYQRTANDIIYGKITGQNKTSSAFGGTARALMLAMADDFSVKWDWVSLLTEEELEGYQNMLVQMKASKSPNVRACREVIRAQNHDSLIRKLAQLKEGILSSYATPVVKKKRAEALFRTCVASLLCPVCLEEADYASEVLAVNKVTGKNDRTKSTLTCIENGCNSGKAIDTYNIMETLEKQLK